VFGKLHRPFGSYLRFLSLEWTMLLKRKPWRAFVTTVVMRPYQFHCSQRLLIHEGGFVIPTFDGT
jgi:hypothetical protein